MKFYVNRVSQGAVSKKPPCTAAVRGPESEVWPGEYQWFIELNSLEELTTFLEQTGGALGLYAPGDGDEYPSIEIFDDDEE